MKQLQEKTAVVTGADREPGRGIAQYLARLGDRKSVVSGKSVA